ncbi:MAG TPA: aspartate-semialdehyde dehydrogenase [Pseudobdellovibrionaceae bacterium]|nr:aspartate-semialdehyde dehydrogenase [Pseudobdellovibrionaceae bacterium]
MQKQKVIQKNKVQINLGLVGATGMVGKAFLEVLSEKNWKPNELRLFSSENSEGKTISFLEENYNVQSLSEGCFKGLDIVFFSAGDDISLKFAPQAVKEGAYVIDNSAAFRMNPELSLVVPECNGELLKDLTNPTIIANPNCSTIQMVVALQAFRSICQIEDIKVSTYQSVSGAGLKALEELVDQTRQFLDGEEDTEMESNKDFKKQNVFSRSIRFNLIPQIGSFDESGNTSEENKMIHETRKILNLPHLKVSAMTIRVPVLVGHSEVVWVRFDRVLSRTEVHRVLSESPGVIFTSQNKDYPTPIEIAGKNEVYVGRVHQDICDPQTWIFWIVADNLRKGAATNGIQIAEALIGM